MVFIHIIRGRPSGLLQFPGGEAVKICFASVSLKEQDTFNMFGLFKRTNSNSCSCSSCSDFYSGCISNSSCWMCVSVGDNVGDVFSWSHKGRL